MRPVRSEEYKVAEVSLLGTQVAVVILDLLLLPLMNWGMNC